MFEDWPKLSSQKKLKKVVLIFVVSLGLNFLWENLHAGLYLHYQGQQVTELILLRAALFDALVITLIFLTIIAIPAMRKFAVLWICSIALVFAILLEVYALNTDRWAYTAIMPLVPLLKTGLLPTVQLALTAWVSLWSVNQGLNREKFHEQR